jgi:hypothetical protein
MKHTEATGTTRCRKPAGRSGMGLPDATTASAVTFQKSLTLSVKLAVAPDWGELATSYSPTDSGCFL